MASALATLASNSTTPDMVEHEGDRAGLGQVAAGSGERRAHLAGGAVAVIGQDLDDHSDPARAIALVADLVIALGIPAGRLLDRAIDVVLRHVLRARRQHGGAQARVHRRVGHAQAGGDGDLARQLAEQLGLRRILPPLAVHDVLELRMSSHDPSRSASTAWGCALHLAMLEDVPSTPAGEDRTVCVIECATRKIHNGSAGSNGEKSAQGGDSGRISICGHARRAQAQGPPGAARAAPAHPSHARRRSRLCARQPLPAHGLPARARQHRGWDPHLPLAPCTFRPGERMHFRSVGR